MQIIWVSALLYCAKYFHKREERTEKPRGHCLQTRCGASDGQNFNNVDRSTII